MTKTWLMVFVGLSCLCMIKCQEEPLDQQDGKSSTYSFYLRENNIQLKHLTPQVWTLWLGHHTGWQALPLIFGVPGESLMMHPDPWETYPRSTFQMNSQGMKLLELSSCQEKNKC